MWGSRLAFKGGNEDADGLGSSADSSIFHSTLFCRGGACPGR
jgi:hypothetical protein